MTLETLEQGKVLYQEILELDKKILEYDAMIAVAEGDGVFFVEVSKNGKRRNIEENDSTDFVAYMNTRKAAYVSLKAEKETDFENL